MTIISAADARPVCEHGPRVKRAGTGQRSGKPFAGYFCPANPGVCEPIWVTSEVIARALAAWAADDATGGPTNPAGDAIETPARPAGRRGRNAADLEALMRDDPPPF